MNRLGIGLVAAFSLVTANFANADVAAFDGRISFFSQDGSLDAELAQPRYELIPDGGGLPSDLGPVSIEASRREVQADITDWSDDRANTHTAKVLACALGGVEAGLIGLPAGVLASVGLVGSLEGYLTGARLSHGASTPLSAPLADLANQVPFSQAELKTLVRLMNRQVQDVSDRIRLAIDTQSFLMKVSLRLYNEQITYHFKRTEGFLGFFRSDIENCAAFTLVAERDNQLIAAANGVLALYNSLEHELKD